ncbi:MAG TPA: hypothetical protein VMC80_01105 [Patescibacteria group bacterium]|nr:hypothetical protein [Patescibacteria group bacterium]
MSDLDHLDDIFVDKLYPYKAEFAEAHGEYLKAKNEKNLTNMRRYSDMMYSIIFETGLYIALNISELQENMENGSVSGAEKGLAETTLAIMRLHFNNINMRLKKLSAFQQTHGLTNAPDDYQPHQNHNNV